jgi:hypothetical protein
MIMMIDVCARRLPSFKAQSGEKNPFRPVVVVVAEKTP